MEILEHQRAERLLKDTRKIAAQKKKEKHERESTCATCNQKYKKNENWVQCDECAKWHHFECAKINENDDVKEIWWSCCS